MAYGKPQRLFVKAQSKSVGKLCLKLLSTTGTSSHEDKLVHFPDNENLSSSFYKLISRIIELRRIILMQIMRIF